MVFYSFRDPPSIGRVFSKVFYTVCLLNVIYRKETSLKNFKPFCRKKILFKMSSVLNFGEDLPQISSKEKNSKGFSVRRLLEFLLQIYWRGSTKYVILLVLYRHKAGCYIPFKESSLRYSVERDHQRAFYDRETYGRYSLVRIPSLYRRPLKVIYIKNIS